MVEPRAADHDTAVLRLFHESSAMVEPRAADHDTAVLRLFHESSAPRTSGDAPVSGRLQDGVREARPRHAEPPDGGTNPDVTRAARLPDVPQAIPSVPEHFRESVEVISGAIVRGDYLEAGRLIGELRDSAVTAFGLDHPHTAEILALEAYTDHLMGRHARSAEMSLRLALLRHQRRDARAREEVIRAVVSWSMLSDPETAGTLGRQILLFWKLLAAGAEPTAAEEQELADLRDRLTARDQPTPASQVRS
jgi:hypothetical protein